MHRSFLKAGLLTAVAVVLVAACSTNLTGFDPDDASTFGDQQALDSALPKDANGVHPDASLKDGSTKDAVADSSSSDSSLSDANTGHDSSSIYDAGGGLDASALNACGICDRVWTCDAATDYWVSKSATECDDIR